MPFRSEKQRRFLWAEHPDIARRWADEYPLNGKKLPMYAKDRAENSDEQPAKSEADVVKAAKDILKRIKMPTNTGPTYAGQTDISSEQASTSILDENTPKVEETPELNKCGMIPGTGNAQKWENEKARAEGRPAQRISAVPGVKRQIVPNIYNPPPMAMSAQSANSSSKPAAAQSATPANDAANKLMKNTIGNFGPIAANGNLNGNAAFGVKNSPNSSKTSNYRASEKSARISAPMCPCGCGEKSYNCTCPKWCTCRNPGMPCAPKKRKAKAKLDEQEKSSAGPQIIGYGDGYDPAWEHEPHIGNWQQQNKTYQNFNRAAAAVSPLLLNSLGRQFSSGVGSALGLAADLGHASFGKSLREQQNLLKQGPAYTSNPNSRGGGPIGQPLLSPLLPSIRGNDNGGITKQNSAQKYARYGARGLIKGIAENAETEGGLDPTAAALMGLLGAGGIYATIYGGKKLLSPVARRMGVSTLAPEDVGQFSLPVAGGNEYAFAERYRQPNMLGSLFADSDANAVSNALMHMAKKVPGSAARLERHSEQPSLEPRDLDFVGQYLVNKYPHRYRNTTVKSALEVVRPAGNSKSAGLYGHFIHAQGLNPQERKFLQQKAREVAKFRQELYKSMMQDDSQYEFYAGGSPNFRDDVLELFQEKYPAANVWPGNAIEFQKFGPRRWFGLRKGKQLPVGEGYAVLMSHYPKDIDPTKGPTLETYNPDFDVETDFYGNVDASVHNSLSSMTGGRYQFSAPAKTAASSPAWQRAAGQNDAGGLNAKGRASYNNATGGNLKAPVTESKPTGERKSRQDSFCARMGGMKKKLTGKDTANDPDSRINKALRKWNCKSSAYKGITEFSGMPGPDQISHAVSQLGMLKALVRPDDSVLKQRGITRSGFQSGLRDIYNHSRNKDRFELSELAPQPNTHAALGGLGGLGAAGLLGYAGVRDPAVLAGTAVIPAVAAYFRARNKRHNLLNTAKLVKDYGLLRPKLLRQAYPLLAADD